MSWDEKRELCREFSRILEGDGSLDENGVCLVQRFRSIDFKILGLTFSPVKGPEGNIEFLAHLTLADREGIEPDTSLVVAQAHETLKG